MDDDRAARVKEWIESVGASSGNYYGVSCGNQPSTQSTHTIAKKDSSDEAAGGPLDLPASEVSADSFSEVESASALDTNSATHIKTTHDISLTGDEWVPSVLESLAGNAIDGVERSVTPESTANATNSAGLAEKGDTSNDGVLKPAEIFLQEVNKAKRTPSRYPFESFEPLDRSTREAYITFRDRWRNTTRLWDHALRSRRRQCRNDDGLLKHDVHFALKADDFTSIDIEAAGTV
jgi:hypothetical protein